MNQKTSTAQLKLNLDSYRRLIAISRDLASTLELDVLLRRIIASAAELSQAEAASILLYDEVKKELHFQATTNQKSEAILKSIVVPADSLAGWVAINHQPVNVADVSKDSRWFTQVGKKVDFTTRSIIAIPMIAKGKMIGVLEALNKYEGTFTQEDQESLLALGSLAAVAIENTRLFQQSDLISELIHELRTPLSSITTISYLLQRSELSNEKRSELAQVVHKESMRLNELATTYLDWARLESGRSSFSLSSFDVVALFQDCCDIYQPKAAEKGIEIQLDMQLNLPDLTADRDKIMRVIQNLLSNAIKYNRPQGRIFIKSWVDKYFFYIAVADTGAGMSEEDLSKVFERFFRSGRTDKTIPGTGLGLSICKRIVESHGGKIDVKSQLEQGTTFTISLPIVSSGN